MSGRSSGEDYLLYSPWWNVSGRSLGRESLLHALCWNLSSRSVREECHACAAMSGHSSGVEFLLHARAGIRLVVCRLGSLSHSPCLESVRSFGGWGVFLTRPVLESEFLTRPMLESVWSPVVSGSSVTRPILKYDSSCPSWPRDGISLVVW